MESPQWSPRTRLPPLPSHMTRLHTGGRRPSGVLGNGSRSSPTQVAVAAELRYVLTQLQSGSSGSVSALVDSLIRFLSGALRGFDREWWRDLVDVLRLLRPLREHLAGGRARLLPALEQLHRQYERYRPLLSDLDIPGVLHAAFPTDPSTLFRLPENLERHYRAQQPPVCVHELALYVGDVGAELAAAESVWRCGRKGLPRALRTDLPLTVPSLTHHMTDPSEVPEILQQHLKPEAAEIPVSGYQAAEIPLSGYQAAEIPVGGYQAAEIPVSGYQAAEIPVSGYQAAEIPLSGYQAAEIPVSGYQDAEIPVSGYQAAEIPVSGYQDAEIPVSGYQAAEIPVSGYQAAEIPVSGYQAAEIPVSGYQAAEIPVSGYQAAEIPLSGYQAAEIPVSGYQAAEIPVSGYQAAEIPVSGYQAAEIQVSGYQAAEIPVSGYQAAEIPVSGYQDAEIPVSGYQAAEIPVSGYQAAEIPVSGYQAAEIPVGGYQAAEIPVSGYQDAEIPVSGYQDAEIPVSGYQDAEIPVSGYQDAEIPVSGYQAAEIPVSGYQAAEIPVSGYQAAEIPVSGYQDAEIPVSRYQEAEIPVSGYQAAEIPVSGYQAAEIPVSGYQDAEIPVSGYQEAEIPVSGYQAAEIPVSGYQAAEIPVSGYQAAEILVWYRHVGKVIFLYLNRSGGLWDCFYDLRVTPAARLHPEHFLFSPFGILHVHPVLGSEVQDLGAWHREAVLCRTLRTLPFYRDFPRRRPFRRWQRNVRRIRFLRRREMLSRRLLRTVPHYSAALYHINRFLQELTQLPFLPVLSSHSMSIDELEAEHRHVLSEATRHVYSLLGLASRILEMVRQDTYLMVQTGLEECCAEVARRGQMQHSDSWLQRLGKLNCLVGLMICENLTSILQQNVSVFVSSVMQMGRPFLLISLEFEEDGELRLCPPAGQIQRSIERMLEAMLSLVLQVMATSGQDLSSPSAMIPCPPDHGSPVRPVLGGQYHRQLLPAPTLTPGKCREMPMPGGLRIEGHQQRAHYLPLDPKSLQHMLLNDCWIQEDRQRLQRLLQDSLAEVEAFCKDLAWLSDVHLYVQSWSPHVLEKLRGSSARDYEDLILKLQLWEARVNSMNDGVTTAMLEVSCEAIHTQTGGGLADILQDILVLLTSEVADQSRSLILQLSQAVDIFREVSAEISSFSKCADKVGEYKMKKPELEERVEHVRCLYEVIRMNYRQQTAEEQTLNSKLMETWDLFQHFLKTSGEFLSSHLSSMSGSLERSFQAYYKEAEDLIVASNATVYRDPSKSVAPILKALGALHHKLSSSLSQLRDLSHSRHILQGQSFDFSAISLGERQVRARQDSWRLLSKCQDQIAAWKLRPLIKVNMEQMREMLQQWECSLQELILILPEGDPVLHSVGSCLEDITRHLPLLQSLLDPAVTHSHWAAISAVMGKNCVRPETLTLMELLSCPLLREQEQIHKILLRARAEFSVHQDFGKIQALWQEREVRLVRFFLCVCREDPSPDASRRPPSGRFRDCAQGYSTQDTGSFLLADTRSLCSLIDDSLLSLKTIRSSPYSAARHNEISGWIQKLKNLGQVVNLWVTFQGKWVFLTKVQREMNVSLPEMDMVTEFQSIDLSYRSFLEVMVRDPLVLSILTPSKRRDWHFYGDSLCSFLQRGIGVMEDIIGTLEDVLYLARCDFPRLFFLSDQDVIDALAASPEPSDLLPCTRLCFPHFTDVLFHIQSPESSDFPLISSNVTVGVKGSNGETLKFSKPIAWNPRAVSWLIELEQRVHQSLKKQLSICLTEGRQSCLHRGSRHEDLRLWLEQGRSHILQCLMVTEEVVWCEDVERLILTDQRARLRDWQNLRVNILVQKLRQKDRTRPESSHCVLQEQAALCVWISQAVLQRDRTLDLLDTGIQTLDSFSWAKLLKYKAPTWEPEIQLLSQPEEPVLPSPPLCVVDVLGHVLPYEHEYVGADMKSMESSISEKTSFGLILALERYQCGAVIGQDEGLRTQTLLALGGALGRHVVVLKCWSGLNISRLALHLQGALQGGAWLVLDSVDRLSTSVLASLGQLLGEIQASYEALMNARDSIKDRRAEIVQQIHLDGRTMSVRRSYGCFFTIPHMDASLALPCSLRLLLRPVSFCPPDLHYTAQLALLSAGFQEHFLLAKKLSCFLRLAQESGAIPAANTLSLLKNVIQKAIVLLRSAGGVMGQPGDPVHCPFPQSSPVTTSLQEEPSLVSALLSSSLWSSSAGSEDSHLMDLLRRVFPASVFHPPCSPAAALLSHAIGHYLYESGLEGHPELSNNVMQLFQAIQQSLGVLLTGPAGGGKTVCWRSLQGALNHLAASEVVTNPEVSLSYGPVHSVHLFPNSLSPAELFGVSPDGNSVFSRILHRTESTLQKWIILDGSAALWWLEPISCLFGPHPVLTLGGGQQLHLTDKIRLLFEMPDTSALSPAMSTLCSFVYCGGQEIWRTIVKASLSGMYIRYCITPSTQHKLLTMSEYLIPRTLCFMKEHGITTSLHPHPAIPSPSACGVHQVSSFCTILHALLDQHLLRDQSRQPPEQAEHIAGEPLAMTPGWKDVAQSHTSWLPDQEECVPPDNQWRAQTFFLYAFIWAFGGPLHPRHRSEFDAFLKESLVRCVLQVGIPQDTSVFDVTPTPDGLSLTATCGAGQTEGEGLLYAARCLALSGRPVLLVGAPGSGKTSLAQSLFPPGVTTTRIAVSSLLETTHLRQVLKTQDDVPSTSEMTKVRVLRGRQIFFLDDLHKARADPESRTQPVLEVVRQIVSDHGSGAHYNILATTSPPEDGCGSMCPRLSRLFCVLVMASASSDVLLSLFSPRFTVWLKKSIPVQQPKEFSVALAAASISLYHQVTKAFSLQYWFSLHYLHRMLQSMTFLCLSPGAHLPAVTNASMSATDFTRCGIVRLWLHEALRTFGDGLKTREENAVLRGLLRECVIKAFSHHSRLENADVSGTIEQPLPSSGDGRPQSEGQTIGTGMETNGKTEPDVESCDQSPRTFLLSPELLLLDDEDLQSLSFLHDYSHGLHVRADSYRERSSKSLNMVPTHHNLTLSPEDCHHLAHLTRVLHLPRGHIILLSQHPATGRRSLARLAAQLTHCAIQELGGEETTEERHAVIQEACWKAGLQASPVALLVGEGTPEQELEALIREGTFPGLYNAEQEEAILQTMLQINEKSSYKSASNKSLRERYNSQVRNNLHVILLQRMGAGSSPLQQVTYTDMYHPWSRTSLQQVADKLLDQSLICGPPACNLSRVMSSIHLLAQSYCCRMWPHLPVASPGAFITFIKIYLKVSSELQNSIDKEEERLQCAVSRIQQVQDVRKQCTKEMETCSRHLLDVEKEKIQWSTELEKMEEEERRVTSECENLESAKERLGARLTRLQGERQQELEQARREWAAVQRDLKMLDVEEIRSYRAPPPPVIMVTNLLCTLFGRESGWENAKLLIGQENFYQDLQFYDGHKMTDSVFSSLTRAVKRPEFSVHLVRPVSTATASLCQWLLGLQRYCGILRTLEKRRSLLSQVEAEDLEMATRMAAQRLLQDKLRTLKAQMAQNLQKAQETEQYLKQDLHELRSKSTTAQECESRAQPHLTTWSAALETLQRRLQSLQTDALLVSASITYFGGLPWARCISLLGKWWSVCHGDEVSVDPDDVAEVLDPPNQEQSVPGHLLELLGDPSELTAWQKERLPMNPETLTRAALLRASGFYSVIRPVLILDPDLRVERWLQVLLRRGAQDRGKTSPSRHHGDCARPVEETPELCVIEASEMDVTQRMCSAAQQGLCVLIRNVEKAPSCLELIRSLRYRRGDGLHSVSSWRQPGLDPPACSARTPSQPALSPAAVDEEAWGPCQLFLSTSLPLGSFVEEVGAAFLKDVTVVEVSLGPAGLEEELVQEMVLSKDPRLQEERWSLSWNALELMKDLRASEDQLLDYVSSGRSPLVKDVAFLTEVSSCEEVQAFMHSSLLDVEALQQGIQEDIAPYVSAARCCAHLYSRLLEASRLSPHYHFPASSVLSWALSGLRGQRESRRDLEKVLTSGILTRVLPMMAEEHRRVLHVLLAVGRPHPLEWFSFLGLTYKSLPEILSSCIQRPQWVNIQAWEEIGQLEKISAFQGIRSSLSAQAKQWQEYFTLRSTVIGPIPCSSFSHLTLFQTAILWRILKPECLGLVLSHLTSCVLGPEPDATCEIGGEAISQANPQTPLLFIRPSASPHLPTDLILHKAKKMGKKVKTLSWRETVTCAMTDTLRTAQQEGQWLLLDWHWGLAGLLEAGEDEVNPEFRLFITAEEETLHTVPVDLRHGSHSTPCALRLSPRHVLPQSCSEVVEDVGEKDPVTLRLLILHTILLLRQEYSPSVQHRTYCWGNRDLRDALCVVRAVRDRCQDLDKTLAFITGAVIYGGHIVEEEDAESVMAVVQHCLQESPKPGSRGLTHMVTTGPWGHTATRLVQKLLTVRDPAALGLSEGLKHAATEVFGHRVLSELLITQDVWTSPPSTAPPLRGRGASSGSSTDALCTVMQNTVSQCVILLLELEEEQKRAYREVEAACLLMAGLESGQAMPPEEPLLKATPPKELPLTAAPPEEPPLKATPHEEPPQTATPPEEPPLAAAPPKEPPLTVKPCLLRRFLLGEWQLLHSLLRAVTQEARDVASSCLCKRCQEIRRLLGEGQVPPWWNLYSQFSISLQAWIQSLRMRLRLLSSYMSPASPPSYNISVFQQPSRLLHSLLQEQARDDHQEVQHYRLLVQVSGRSSSTWQPEGVSLVGIHLRHALWDTRQDLLQETLSPQLCALPVVHISVVPETSPHPAQAQYMCPLYCGGDPGGHIQHQGPPLLLLPLPTNISPSVWSQRQVHALSLL
ncbi:dynein heavy chain domain-containing protein 1 isoform X2 [Dendropsophus ebraccatus]|uniref:dynein heavy chain domain-containing protein 1 isoform X2 n=1 Tax=Dendropsophus ebraccatus TaxID=150705 RepID=UPI003831D5DD